MWAILYGLMGISAYLIQRSDSPKRKGALSLYWAQLFVNFIWTPVFFGLRSLSGAAVVVVVLLVLVITMTAVFYQIEKKSAYLNIPYILWTAFASYLTIGVLLLNRQIS